MLSGKTLKNLFKKEQAESVLTPEEFEQALADVQKDGYALPMQPPAARKNREIVLAAVRKKGGALQYAAEELKDDFEIVMAAVTQSGHALDYAGQTSKKNREIVMAAVTQSGHALDYADQTSKKNREIVLAAVRQYGRAIHYAHDRLKRDPEIALAAVRQNGEALRLLPKGMKNEREITLAAVRQKGMALTHASQKFKNDPEIVMAAVQQNAWAIAHASDAMRANREIALATVRKNGRALAHMSDGLKGDREIVLAAVTQSGKALNRAARALQEDPEIAAIAVAQDVYAYKDLPPACKNNRAVTLAAVRRNGLALAYASKELKNDPETVTAAVTQNWRAIRYAGKELKKDPDMTATARRQEERQSVPKTQALNFMWLNLDLPAKPDPADGSIRMPMPEEYILNVREAGQRHPKADIHLWIDSRRLTEKQLDYLTAVTEEGLPNVRVKDLCDIPAYKNEELYSRTETNQYWRDGYQGVVWLQVDAAKILIPLQGDYDQSFFADLDHAHLDIESEDVQKMLHEQGMLIGGSGNGSLSMENQMWGFDRSRKNFFEDYYAEGLRVSYEGQIAYHALHTMMDSVLRYFEGTLEEEICLPIDSVGLKHAEHPGHEWSKDCAGRSHVSGEELQNIFNARACRTTSETSAPATPAPASVSPARPQRFGT